MQPVDTNRPSFQPLGCGSICTQGFALGWYRSAPLALEAIRRVWILGSVTTSAVALSVPRALPWAGIGARRWRLRPSAGFGFWGASQLRLWLYLYPGFALAGIGARRWRLRPSGRVWIFGERHNFGCGSICTQGFALGWYR